MPIVFGRNAPAHSYDAALISLQTSKAKRIVAEAKSAIACNIRHDHRISEQREEHFDNVCSQPRSARELERAITRYFDQNIRTRDYPDFVYFELNWNNLIYGHAKLTALPVYRRPAINKEVRLARILDINNLRIAFRWLLDARHRKPEWDGSFREYYSIPRSLNNREEQHWIDDWLNRLLDPTHSGRETFIESVLDMLNSIRHEKAFQPTWATTWVAFEPHARTPNGEPHADRWVQVMGMGKNAPQHWFIVLKYTVAQAGTLARPTQLDAGWYEYHFPSSQQTPLEFGGRPMDLRISPAASALLPEYVHKQIGHPIEHWNETGRLLGRASDWNRWPLTEIRRAHERLVKLCDGSSAQNSCPNRNGVLCVGL